MSQNLLKICEHAVEYDKACNTIIQTFVFMKLRFVTQNPITQKLRTVTPTVSDDPWWRDNYTQTV